MVEQVSTWRIERSVRSIYIGLQPYRLINYARSALFDLLVFLPAAGFGLWWASGSGGLHLEPTADWGATGDNSYLFKFHLAQYYPMLLALAYGAILLWKGRGQLEVAWYKSYSMTGPSDTAQVRFPRRVIATPGGINTGTAIGFGVLAVIDLVFVPGNVAQRFTPLIFMTAWVWLMRNQVRGRARLLTQTRAGFRPPARAVLRGRDRAILMLQYGEVLGGRRDGGYGAAARAVRRDPPLQAWFLAKGVDWALSHARIAVAEELLAPQWPGLADATPTMPAYLAARATFAWRVGSVAEASKDFASAVERCGGHVPTELSWAAAAAADAAVRPAEGAVRDSARLSRGRSVSARQIWARHYAIVLGELLGRTRENRESDPETAAAATRQIIKILIVLKQPHSLSSLSAAEAARLDIVAAEAHTLLADLSEDAGRWLRAAVEHYAAVRLYRVNGDGHAAGVARARQARAVLMAGGLDAQSEGEALDDLRSGLQQIEDGRGALRVSANRAKIVTAYEEEIYAPILAVLNSAVVHHPGRAAELVLWLMESTRRNALADALALARGPEHARDEPAIDRAGPAVRKSGHGVDGYEGTDEELRGLARQQKDLDDRRQARLERAYQPKPVDLGRIYRRLGNRVALSYRCTEAPGGWLVTCVMVSPLGLRTHQWRIDGEGRPNPGAEADWYKRPASVLGRLSMELKPDGGADTQASQLGQGITHLHNTQLKRRVWTDLAARLLPPELQETLRRTAAGQAGRPVLVIVPDGPLCAIPFAGLRLGDDRALAEHAVVVFLPNFDLVSEDAPEPPARRPVVAANLGETALVLDPARLDLRARFETADFVRELAHRPPPDVAVISNHGLLAAEPYKQVLMLADGSSISAAEAPYWPWPRTVVLGTCWAASMAIAPGEDTVGFPIACLLGGATTVVGSQAPIYNTPESQAFIALAVAAEAYGEHPATRLAGAMRDFAAARRGGLPAPSAWAGLTVWTTRLPAAPAGSHETLIPRWMPQGTVRRERSATAAPALAGRLPLSASLGRVLLHASTGTAHAAVDTLDALAAVVQVNDLNWTSYLVRIGVGVPQGAARAEEAEQAAESVAGAGSDGGGIAVSAALGEALRVGARLADELGDPAVTPAHLVYGIVNDESCVAVKWIRGHDGADPGGDLVAQLSDLIFGFDLPPLSALPKPSGGQSDGPDAAQPRAAERSAATGADAELPVPAPDRSNWAVRRGIYRHGARNFATKTMHGLVSAGLLGALVVTSSLHQVGNAPSTTDQLRDVAAQLAGAIRIGGSAPRPALYLGALGTYYTQPALTGVANVANETVQKSVPSSLDSWDVFTIPGHATTTTGAVPAKITIHGGVYAATVYCASGMTDSLCFAVAQLPGSAAPSGSLWHGFNPPTDLALGTYTSPVDVLTHSGPSGPVATAELLTDVQSSGVWLTAQPDGAGTISLLSPVVLQGGDYGLPIIGVVDGSAGSNSGAESYVVIPMGNILPYLDQLADWQGGALPGATGVLGVQIENDPTGSGALVDTVVRGSPADFAGIESGDVITAVDGAAVTGASDLLTRIAAITPGSKVPVAITRGGARTTLEATIGYRPL